MRSGEVCNAIKWLFRTAAVRCCRTVRSCCVPSSSHRSWSMRSVRSWRGREAGVMRRFVHRRLECVDASLTTSGSSPVRPLATGAVEPRHRMQGAITGSPG